MKNKFSHPLMENNITKSDINKVIEFLKKNPILTQNKMVKKFEEDWSKWLGTKYSVMVNSGSSANFLSILSLKLIYQKNKSKKEIIVPPLTWISDIVSVVSNNFKPIFVDIDFKNLAMDPEKILKKINKNTFAIFLTHAQGFNGLNNKLLKEIKRRKIFLIEDVCESHGAKYKNKKLGNFGNISNFSFYYAHHLSTIEGGMISTNSKKIYETCRMLRAHGMLREAGNKSLEKKFIKKFKNLSPKFIFMYPGFNMRSNEVSAVIGINQLKRLDNEIKKRNKNLEHFLKMISKKHFFVDYDMNGISNYALPIILKTKSKIKRDHFEKILSENKIEFRRGNAGGGNQMRQPYLKKIIPKFKKSDFKNVEHVHSFGYYIGNYPDLTKEKISKICKVLNSAI